MFIDSLETAARLADSAPSWNTADEGVGRLLLTLGAKARRFTEQLEIQPDFDWPLVPTRDGAGYSDLWELSRAMGYVDLNRRITPDGWRRIDALRSTAKFERQAFVAMWFSPSMDDAWSNGFKPGIEASKHYTAYRIDGKEFNGKIDDQIVAEIRRSGLLVADFTGHRGGVYFEAGFGMGLGMPVIWTCRKDDIGNAHFDTRQYNHIVWETPEELAARLDARIRATVLPIVRTTV